MGAQALWGVAAASGSNTELQAAGSWDAQIIPTSTSTGSTLGGGSPSTESTTCNCTRSPVNTATGDFWHTFDDLLVPGRGIPLSFTHTYNSLDAAQEGPLGFGWTDSYNMSVTTDASGLVTVHEEGGSTLAYTCNGSCIASGTQTSATLTHNGDGTYTFVRANQDSYVFSAPSQTAPGQLLKETDRNGYATTLTYTNGLLTSVTDPAGRSLTLSYNTSNLIASVTDSANRSVSFSYDGSGNLTDVIDATAAMPTSRMTPTTCS